ncbi:MAG TPA: hypothetical protein VJP59_05830 [Gemmatimonadota bacterium]|nr:hypothetical protein [Gemmatimonadota bacterium]
MKVLSLLVLVLTACVSTPQSQFIDHAVFEGFAPEQVRGATRQVLEEIAPSGSKVRTANDVLLTEGRFGVCGRDVACGSGTQFIQQNTGTPWTTVEVRLLDLGEDTGVDVEIEYETNRHCGDGYAEVTCLPEELGSTGFLERRIIDEIRARLEARGDLTNIASE